MGFELARLEVACQIRDVHSEREKVECLWAGQKSALRQGRGCMARQSGRGEGNDQEADCAWRQTSKVLSRDVIF